MRPAKTWFLPSCLFFNAINERRLGGTSPESHKNRVLSQLPAFSPASCTYYIWTMRAPLRTVVKDTLSWRALLYLNARLIGSK